MFFTLSAKKFGLEIFGPNIFGHFIFGHPNTTLVKALIKLGSFNFRTLKFQTNLLCPKILTSEIFCTKCNSIKEINRLRKEISRLLRKEMSNVYLKILLRKTDVIKLRFSKFKKFVTMSVFGELNSRRYH